MTESRAARALVPLLLVTCLAVLVAAWFDLRGRFKAVAEQQAAAAQAQERLERAVQLFRFERGSKGLGTTALLEQLRHYAPLLDLSTTPQREIPAIQKRVDDILVALSDLGKDAFDPLLAAVQQSTPGKDDELVRWLLQALCKVDAARGKDILVACAHGVEIPTTSRIRVQAAQQLLEIDKPLAARVVAQILAYESAVGIDPTRMPPELQQKFTGSRASREPMRMLFNFVDLLVAAGGTDVEEKLIMVASRPEQDRMTVQTCVRHLGDLKSARAVKLLKKLFDNPPEMIVNPIFQNACLDAIAKIEGAAACSYFHDVLRARPDDRVAAKVQELIKTHCP